jgi:hypothetical protein
MTTNSKSSSKNVTREMFSVIIGEAGKGTTWAMVFCLGVIAAYLKYGKNYLDANINPFYHNLLVLTLAVVTVFTVGCVLHMIFIGDKSDRELCRDLRRQNDELFKFIAGSQTRLCELQSAALRCSGLIRPHNLENINQLRRIINALHQRCIHIRGLLSSRDKIDLIDAHELLSEPLTVIEDCMSSLIGSNPIPPISADEVVSTIETLTHEIETDLRRIELKQRAA